MIPNRDEAVAVALENAAIDAAKYERVIEAELMVWDGRTEIRIDIPRSDSHIVPHITASLKNAGFTARSTERTNSDWWVMFK